MTAKLTKPQIAALQFLTIAPFVKPWWGGKPHTGWPKGLSGRTFDKLYSLRFVTVKHVGRFDRAVTITEAGTAALIAAIKEQ